MLQVVECRACGFTDLGWTESCPGCGGPLAAQVAQDDGEDPLFGLNLVEGVPQTVAYQQLREICEAAAEGRLSEDSLQFLLAELEVYLQRQILMFAGQDLILEGLWALCEACDLASQVAEQGRSVLVLAERVAAEGDAWVSQALKAA